jgi:hypothetical protein
MVILRSNGAATDGPVTDSNQLSHKWHLSERETTTGPIVSIVKIRDGIQTGCVTTQSQVNVAASTEVRPKCN